VHGTRFPNVNDISLDCTQKVALLRMCRALRRICEDLQGSVADLQGLFADLKGSFARQSFPELQKL